MKRHNNDIHGDHGRTLRFLKRVCGFVWLLLFVACDSGNQLGNNQKTDADVDSLLEKAYAYEDSSYYDLSLTYLREALALVKQKKDSATMFDCYADIAVCCQRLGDLPSAIEASEQAVAISTAMNDAERQSSAYNNLSAIYMVNKDYGKARELIEKAISIEESLPNPKKLSIRYGIASEVNVKLKEYDRALDYGRRAYELDKNEGDTIKMGRRLAQMGDAYAAKSDFKNAEQLYRKAVALLEQKAERTSLCITYKQLGLLYKQMGRRQDAFACLKRSCDMAKTIGFKMVMMQTSEQMADLTKLSDPAKALEYMTRSMSLKDSLYNEQTNHLTSSYAAKLSVTEKNHTIEQQKNRLKTHKLVLIVTSVVTVLLVLLCCALYYMLRERTKSRNILRKIDNMRTAFFTNITHEFRTPLTIIGGLTEQMITNQQMPRKEVNRCLNDISRHGEELLKLVNELLDVSKMIIGEEKCQWMHGNLAAYVGMTVTSYRKYAASKSISLMFNSSHNLIEADFVGEYVSKILRNLISNSMKFTKGQGNILVSLKMEDERITLAVEDTGVGFPDEDLPHIFEMFYQGKNTEGKASTGIGLNYVKQMVNNMHGDIKAENTGNGARMVITMPQHNENVEKEAWNEEHVQAMAKPIAVNEAPDMPPDDDFSPTGALPKVLIVEDNTDIAFYISTVLGSTYSTFFAMEGEEALRKSADIMPDIILTDVMMPGMNGLELCRKIKQSHVTNHIPIIVITAKTEERDKMEALEAGADAFLVKPFNARELVLRIGNLMAQRRRLVQRQNVAGTEQSGQIAGLKETEQLFVNKLTDLICANMKNSDMNAVLLAEQLAMTRSQLTAKVRQIVGCSLNSYITQVRMNHARRLLRQTDKTIGEVAMACGFDDMGYFGRVFKSQFNCTPSQFRKIPNQENDG